MANRRITQVLLMAEALVVVGLLDWILEESGANPYLAQWLAQNFPAGQVLLNRWAVFAIGAAAVALSWLRILTVQAKSPMKNPAALALKPRLERRVFAATTERSVSSERKPFYTSIDIRFLLLTLSTMTQAASMWFITAGTLRISSFPADSLYYVQSLPFTYWWGLVATLALLVMPKPLMGRPRTANEVSALFLLALYLIGLPSFTYENPRFLDTYYHEGNSLNLLNYGGWLASPNWYGHQFPGAFIFLGQLTAIAGIDSFQLMKFYPVALSWVVVLFVYVIIRMHSPSYAAPASGLLLGGLWFQLHVSPQSLELLMYLGMVFVFLRLIEDGEKRRVWSGIAIGVVPVFVATHPETPLVLTLGLVGFFLLSLLKSQREFQVVLPRLWLPFAGMVVGVVLWWSFLAQDAFNLVFTTIVERAVLTLSQLPFVTPPVTNVPSTPAPSYAFSVGLEQASSLTVWIGGLSLAVFIRRFLTRELLIAGLLLASISTIPLAIFARADVLQRSYLFALFPFAILLPWILERRVIELRGKSAYHLLKAALLMIMIIFSGTIPVTRYGVDPFQYVTSSGLFASELAAGLKSHSILFLHPEEDAWRYYDALTGATSQPRQEQIDMSTLRGGFVKPTSDPTLPSFNLMFTSSDASANYVLVSDYYQNLYALRFGSNAGPYLNQRAAFEADLARSFNLVYSTGMDRIYASRNVT